METRQTTTARQMIAALLDQGADPRCYRRGLARDTGLDQEMIDRLIDEAGPVGPLVDPDVIAERRRHDPMYWRDGHGEYDCCS